METLLQRVSALRGQRDLVVNQFTDAELEAANLKRWGVVLERAQLVIQNAAAVTQKQLEYSISELVSLALAHVFPQPYVMVLRFENKRGRTEAGLYFQDKDGNEMSPMDSSGYGVVDVASFALRLSLWTLRRPRSRATILLDEPFKFVSKDLQSKVAEMLQDLSSRLKLQFIIVTHEDQLVEGASRVFRVTKEGAISNVAVETVNV